MNHRIISSSGQPYTVWEAECIYCGVSFQHNKEGEVDLW